MYSEVTHSPIRLVVRYIIFVRSVVIDSLSLFEICSSLYLHGLHTDQFSVKREKTNKMQQSDVYYQLLSQHVSGIIMPIFRRTKTVLLHMVYCAGSAGCGW